MTNLVFGQPFSPGVAFGVGAALLLVGVGARAAVGTGAILGAGGTALGVGVFFAGAAFPSWAFYSTLFQVVVGTTRIDDTTRRSGSDYAPLSALNLMLTTLPWTAARSSAATAGVKSGPGQRDMASSSSPPRLCRDTTSMSVKPARRTISK